MNIIKQNVREGILNQYLKSSHDIDLRMAGQHLQAAQILERLQMHLNRPYPNPDEDDCDCRPNRGEACPACRDVAGRRYPIIPIEGEM